MSFFGDLSSISLAGLLQNLEHNMQTGTLLIERPGQRAAVYLRNGKICMLATESRPELVQMLVATGYLTAEQLEHVRSQRRGSRKSIGETLVSMGVITDENLREIGLKALFDDACELVVTAEGEFRFSRGGVPARVFDPEERRLNLEISVSHLLLEAARRADLWRLVRQVIPSDSVRFIPQPNVAVSADVADAELVQRLFAALDGTRDVREVLALFTGRRFEVFQLLAQLVRTHAVQAVEADGILSIASGIAAEDPAKARQLVADALREQPNHVGLLTLEATLARQLQDIEGAAAAHKRIAHIKYESGAHEDARQELLRARKLTPKDAAIWERLVEQDASEGRSQEAVESGLQLLRLYRGPGLHLKARELLERLLQIDSENLTLHLELAKSCVDSGDVKSAVRGLARYAKALLDHENYKDARRVYGEILAIEPANRDAQRSIEAIDTAVYQRRREWKRHMVRRVALCVVLFMIAAFLALDVIARFDYAEAARGISRDRLIEEMRYREALGRYRAVAERHYFTPTFLIDVRPQIRDLEAKLETGGK
ncbi:MAG: DUF4388 domain-containing protein [Planctomycetes bacterium]|nr:DUF4388 domain-containing protein [Planctomycetota bacterium]